MKSSDRFHPVAFQKWFAPRHLLKNFSWEGFSFPAAAHMRFVEGRIIEQREEHIRRGMMQEHGKLFASGEERAFAGLLLLRTFQDSRGACRCLRGRHSKPADLRLGQSRFNAASSCISKNAHRPTVLLFSQS